MAGDCKVCVRARGSGYGPELNNQDREGGFIKEVERYEGRVQRISEAVELGARIVLKNSFAFGICRG